MEDSLDNIKAINYNEDSKVFDFEDVEKYAYNIEDKVFII